MLCKQPHGLLLSQRDVDACGFNRRAVRRRRVYQGRCQKVHSEIFQKTGAGFGWKTLREAGIWQNSTRPCSKSLKCCSSLSPLWKPVGYAWKDITAAKRIATKINELSVKARNNRLPEDHAKTEKTKEIGQNFWKKNRGVRQLISPRVTTSLFSILY